MNNSAGILGCGALLKQNSAPPYIGRNNVNFSGLPQEILKELNAERGDYHRRPSVQVKYYFEVVHQGQPMDGLKHAAKMVLEHGTLKSWHHEADAGISKPAGYDNNMSWVVAIGLTGYNKQEGVEAGIVTVAYPLDFFDKTGRKEFPLAQLMMAVASEPVSAFSFYQGAKIIEIKYPAELKKKFPGVKWPHHRIRKYLQISPTEPIVGTIVKPKTGLTPELFSRCVVEAALSGAKFTKADENMHLTLKEVPRFVSRTVKDLQKAGFDLGKKADTSKGKRFLFAPHITANPKDMMDYAKAAVDSGANCLMFSPYYAGGFQLLGEIVETFDVPVYSHTAGMNMFTGSLNWGFAPTIIYQLAASYGATFMQMTATGGYLRPFDIEKPEILKCLREEKLIGKNGMTLAIAGGLGPTNIGANMKVFGVGGLMFLAGTSVYSHPDGASAGVKAIILAHRAYQENGITGVNELIDFGKSLGKEGEPLVHACCGK